MGFLMKLALIYAILALIATAANIGAQELWLSVYFGPFSLVISVLVGTVVGLVIKYILDKRYIFKFKSRDVAHDSQIFFLYCVMGVATTTIFWGFEFGFHFVYETKEMRYLGGVIGLAIGYVAKYHLDKHYVFRTEAV
ncbi:MAG: GtrA family protein [Halomonadaceae bacterium]|nr:MAG: GtrA family protein [Halomonadaceae bacterium]